MPGSRNICLAAGLLALLTAAPALGLQPPAPPAAAEAAGEGPFPPKADAARQIADQVKLARTDNTRVLVIWGGNQYPGCKEAHALLTDDPDVAKVVRSEYRLVPVHYGQPPGWNVRLTEQYSADVKSGDVPFLTVIDSSGRMFANQPLKLFEKRESGRITYDKTEVLKFLNASKPAPIPARTALDKALAQAKSTDRRVFVRFGAPWCGWCRKMDTWLARPDVGPVLEKDFVLLKIDTDRNPGGQAMLNKMTAGRESGIPWFAILEPDGKVVVDSFDSSGQNIGFPAAAAEIEYFTTMLTQGGQRLTPAERDTLIGTLRVTEPASDDAAPADGGEGKR